MSGGSADGVLQIGATFHAHYEVLSRIKAGGMGAVYAVLDRRTLRRRALKVMLPSIVTDPAMQRRFEQEATVTSAIYSEHIVEIFDAGIDGELGAPFIVMELLVGEDLGAIVERRGPLPAAEVVLLLHQASLALERTHAAGIVHRDLKPENLFITSRDDGAPRLKVLDFGVAKVIEASVAAKTTMSVGTPSYMAPEQILGDRGVGSAADLYALAHVAHTLLTGEAYWALEARESTSIFAFFTHVMEGVSELPVSRAAARGVTVPPAFDAWFVRATASEPEGRFASARELVEELSRVLVVPLPAPAPYPVLVTAGAAAVPSGDTGVATARMDAAIDVGCTVSESPSQGAAAPGASAPRRSFASTALTVSAALGVVGLAAAAVAFAFAGPSPSRSVEQRTAAVAPAIGSVPRPPDGFPPAAAAPSAEATAAPPAAPERTRTPAASAATPSTRAAAPVLPPATPAASASAPTCRVVAYYDEDGNKRFKEVCR